MERLSKAEIGFNGLVSSIETVVKNWHPPDLKTEGAYSDGPSNYLRAVLPEDARVEREYRHEGTTCDLCVLYNGILSSSQVLFELKRNLRKKSDYDRLVGQVEGLKPKRNNIFVVMVGDTDPALFGRLKEQFKDHAERVLLSEVKFKIVLVA